MNLLKLRYFIDIADAGSISAAARKNFIAQQSMSSTLSGIEEYYGVKLFVRSTPLRLTEEGKRLYATAKEVLSLMDGFQAGLHAAEPPLILGLAYNGTPPFLGDLIDFINSRRASPLDIQIKTNCDDPSMGLDSAEVYIGMSPPEGFERVKLLEDRMIVVCARSLFDRVYGSRAADRLSMVESGCELEQLHDLPFAAFTPDNRIPPFMHGLTITAKGNSSDISTSLCLKGKCAVVVAEDYARRDFGAASGMLLLPVSTGQEEFSLYLYYRKNKKLSTEARQFIRAAKEFFSVS